MRSQATFITVGDSMTFSVLFGNDMMGKAFNEEELWGCCIIGLLYEETRLQSTAGLGHRP